MKTVKVYHYEAFSKVPNKGNPAGVVLNGDELTEEEMQEIAVTSASRTGAGNRKGRSSAGASDENGRPNGNPNHRNSCQSG